MSEPLLTVNVPYRSMMSNLTLVLLRKALLTRIQTSVSGAHRIDPLAVCLQAQRTDEVLSFCWQSGNLPW